MDLSDRHSANALAPKSDSTQPDSKVIFESFPQDSKQDLEIVSTDAGRQIDLSEEQRANADSPMIEIRDPDSNARDERCGQKWKQSLEMVSIDEGIHIN
jgi:hypothetical protein